MVTASKSKKPDAAAVPQLLAPLSTLLTKVAEFKDKNKGHALSNHLSVVADGIPALGWVAVEPKPAPFIEEMKNAAQYFSNRILKEFKEKDKTHVDWANSFMAILTEVHGYVKKYHTTGVVWNPSVHFIVFMVLCFRVKLQKLHLLLLQLQHQPLLLLLTLLLKVSQQLLHCLVN